MRVGGRTVVEERLRLGPLVRPELPRLARRHHTHHAVPRVRAELGKSLRAINDNVPVGARKAR